MGKFVKINFSAVSQKGLEKDLNTNRIYANGRFNSLFNNNNVRLAMDSSEEQFIFALSDDMEIAEVKTNTKISISHELKKIQQRFKSSNKDIQSKANDLSESVQQTANLIYSISIGEDANKQTTPSFAGLIIDDGKYAVLRLGNFSIFKLENDMLKALVSDRKKAERLLKMGIINDEQAEIILSKQDFSENGSKEGSESEIHTLKQGDLFLICSKGLTDAVGEETISEIISYNKQIDDAAALLVQEAVDNNAKENITAMIIKVEEANEVAEPSIQKITATQKKEIPRRIAKVSATATRKKRPDYSRLASIAVITVVIAAVIFGLSSIWSNLRNASKGLEASTQNGDILSSDNSGTADQDSSIDSDEPADPEFPTADGSISTEEEGSGGGVNSSAPTTYTVKAGDSLSSISKAVYGDQSKWNLIMEANQMTDPDKLYIGQLLIIPAEE
jgi:nucleoid-associated protein YgaU